MKQKSPKEHTMQKWLNPHCDHQGQWWWGYQKVSLVVQSNEEKQKFIDSFNFNRLENKDGD